MKYINIFLLAVSLVGCTKEDDARSIIIKTLSADSIATPCTKEEKSQLYYRFRSDGLCYHLLNQEIALKLLDDKLSKYPLYKDWVSQGGGAYYKAWRTESGIANLSLRNDKGGIAIFIFNHF